MLSQKEAVRFVSEVLGIEKSVERKCADAHAFLNELIVRFVEVIPFQSLSLVAVSPQLRRRPTLEEIKWDVMSGRGGLCYVLNTFMKFLLQALGYDVYFVACSIGVPVDNHIITVVCNLKQHGDRYIVDVGVGWPTFEAIALDFEKESAVYKHSYLQYKFVREEGKVSRWHYSKIDLYTKPEEKPENVVRSWKRVAEIDITPREFDHFDDLMDAVYTDPGLTDFHTSVRVVTYVDQKAFCIKNLSLLLENDEHNLYEVKMADKQELLQTVQKHFPQLHSTAVDALKNYCTH